MSDQGAQQDARRGFLPESFNDQPTGRVLETYRNAVYQRDVDALLALYDDNVLIFDMWGEWSYNGIAAWSRIVTAWLGSLSTERVIVAFDDVRSTIDHGLAIVHAYVTYKAVSAEGTEVRSMNERLTCVLKQNDGVWRIIHQHASAPVEHKSLKAIVSR